MFYTKLIFRYIYLDSYKATFEASHNEHFGLFLGKYVLIYNTEIKER